MSKWFDNRNLFLIGPNQVLSIASILSELVESKRHHNRLIKGIMQVGFIATPMNLMQQNNLTILAIIS